MQHAPSPFRSGVLPTPPPTNLNVASTTAEESGGARNEVWGEEQSTASTCTGDLQSSAKPDFELIWPGSEDLFEVIMSSDAASQWQMPPRESPLSSSLPCPSIFTSGATNPFQHHGSSIDAGAIPSGESHRAVHIVSEMVTTSVGLPSTHRRYSLAYED